MALHHAIDSVAVNGQMIFGWGWCFSDQADHADIQLKLEFVDGNVIWLKCQSHITRVDVLASYSSYRHSVRSGFRFSASLHSDPADAKVSLYLMMHDGSWENMPLPHFFPMAESESTTNLAAKKNKAELLNFFKVISPAQASPIFLIDHALGGGANIFNERRSMQLIEAGHSLLSLRFNVNRLKYEIQYRNATENRSIFVTNFKKLVPFLDEVQLSGVEVNSLVSYPDVFGLLKFIIKLKAKNGLSLKYNVHDFHSLCDSWSLLDQHESFCGLPAPSICNKCIASRVEVFPMLRSPRRIHDWRSEWNKFLGVCDRIQFFSDSSRLLFQQVYKNSMPIEKFIVSPHGFLLNEEAPVRHVVGDPFVIGVVGNISIAKGANILRDMARLILKEQLPIKIVAIGNVETYEPSAAYFSTGSYTPEELPSLLKQYEVGICFLPSVCPETFCFVVSEIMQLQFPLVCFNLGAQAERVGSYARGYVVVESTAESALKKMRAIIKDIKVDTQIMADQKNSENCPVSVAEA